MAAKKGYTRAQRRARKERKQLKMNDTLAKVFFWISLVVFLLVVATVIVPFVVGVVQGLMTGSTTTGTVTDANAMPLATTLEESVTPETALLYLIVLVLAAALITLWIAMGSFVCPFILALGLRRGEDKEERVKKGWIVLYIVLMSITWVPVLLFGGNLFNVLLVIFFLGGYDSLLILVAHRVSLFEAKKARLRRKEEGKLHGGVFFIYLLTKLGLVFVLSARPYLWLATVAISVLAIVVAVLKRLPYEKKKAAVYTPYEME